MDGFSDFFGVRFSSKLAAKHLLKIRPDLICVAALPSVTLMLENVWQLQTIAVINDKLQVQ